MISPHRLDKAAQILRTLSNSWTRLTGIVCERILKFFRRQMTLSTWTRTLTMCLVLVVSSSDSDIPFFWQDQLHFSFMEVWNDKSSVCHNYISWTQVLQKATIGCNKCVTAFASICSGHKHYQTTGSNCHQILDCILAIVMTVTVSLASWIQVVGFLQRGFRAVHHTGCSLIVLSKTLWRCCLDSFPGQPWDVCLHFLLHDVIPHRRDLADLRMGHMKPLSKIILQQIQL